MADAKRVPDYSSRMACPLTCFGRSARNSVKRLSVWGDVSVQRAAEVSTSNALTFRTAPDKKCNGVAWS